MSTKKIKIIKASGEKVLFNKNKLRRSLEFSGASKFVVDNIIEEISNSLYNNITTKEIYTNAFELLKLEANFTAAKYKLKNALMELGPSGFPFEKFISELFIREGYSVKRGQIFEGKCVNHEVDVLAEKANNIYLIECKFHNDSGRKSNVQTPLYIHARFLDIQYNLMKIENYSEKLYQGWVITNTRFTEDALTYANCSGLKMMSWDYPEEGSLKEKIDKSGLHPITCLTTITQAEKQKLLAMDKVFSIDLCTSSNILNKLKIGAYRQEKILREAKGLSTINHNL